jgi:hypothetical protein
LIRDAGEQLAEEGLGHILLCVCRRLAFATIDSLRQPLVCVFARLILTHPDACLGFLVGHTVEVATDLKAAYLAQQQMWAQIHGHEDPNTPAIQVPTETRNGLQYVLETWCDTHEDFVGAYYLKLSVVGLSKLVELALGIPDAGASAVSADRAALQDAVASVVVLGEETAVSKNTNANASSRPHTRSRGPIQKVREEVPFAVRALSVMLREYQVALEHEGAGEDSDEYYDTDSDGEEYEEEGDESYADFVNSLSQGGDGTFADSGGLAAMGLGSFDLGMGMRWDDTEDALDPEAEADALGLREVKIATFVPEWVMTRLAADPTAARAMQSSVGPAMNPVDQQILQSILSQGQ